MIYLFMFFVGLFSWLIAAVSAGGAGLIFLVISGFIIPLSVATPVLALSGTVAGIYRVLIYWKNINWSICKWLIPGTILGSILGAVLFGTVIETQNTNILSFILGVILITSGLLGYFRIHIIEIPAKIYYFFPFGFLTSFISGLIGSSSPVINVMFQKFSLSPNQIIGTKAVNILLLQLTKTLIYMFSIVITQKLLLNENIFTSQEFMALGITTAIGSCIGIQIGKKVLNKLDEKIFNDFLNITMFLFGFSMVIKVITNFR